MKKIIAIAMALIMCLGIVSMVAFAAEDKMTVNVVVPSEWADCNVYGWSDSGEVYGGWPGTKVEGNSFQFPSGVTGLVLSTGTGSPQTVDITDLTFTAGGSATITVGDVADGNKHTYTIAYGGGGSTTTTTKKDETTTPTTKKDETTTTTTTKNPNGKRILTIEAPATWTEAKIYTWEPETYGAYPGAAIQKSGNVFKGEIANDMIHLVITGYKADGTQQKTDDITLPKNDEDVTVKVDADGKAIVVGVDPYYEISQKPAATKVDGKDTTYRVVGDAAQKDGQYLGSRDVLGKWDPASNLGLMKEVETGRYRKNFENVQPGTYELKITKDGTWDVSYGCGDDGKGNITVEVVSACTITVDLTFKADGTHFIEIYGTGVLDAKPGDISMLSVVVLMTLASVTAIVLVVNKKKFI